MVLEFTVGNFLSFYEKKTISFEAQSISELKDNVINAEKHKLLRSLVIYGANSSGKSNILLALDAMKHNILNSVKLNDNDELDYKPFLLAEESEKEPTFFEIIFFVKEKKYRYGFEYNQTKIISEWLFVYKTSKTEIPLFVRTEEGIGVSEKFEEGIGKEEATNDNRLFISLASQLNGKLSKEIIDFFKSYNLISGLDTEGYEKFSLKMLQEKEVGCEDMLNFFQNLELGFENIEVEEEPFHPSKIPDDLPKKVKSNLLKALTGTSIVSLKTTHKKYDKKGNIIDKVLFDKNEHESAGTKKIIDLSGAIFHTLLNGKLLIVDELDSKLHPLITAHIIRLFNNPKTNPNNAQLLFNTHDTNLLSGDFFRRDQIWFTEKDHKEQTDLYLLADINLPDGSKIRNDANLEKNYIRGRYGAIPFIKIIHH